MQSKIIPLALTFDDVLIKPAKSSVIPTEVNLSTKISRNISISIPLSSAAMDTVTEAKMAVAMAREGGIGIIHRNLSIEEQASQIQQVKRSESGMISDPVTVYPDATLEELDKVCGIYKVSGLPVINKEKELVGIITNRDLTFVAKENYSKIKVKSVMTKMPLITAKEGISKEEAFELLKKHKVEKLPIVNKNNILKGLITVKDFIKTVQYPNATKDEFGRLRVGATVGFFGDAMDRAIALASNGVDLIVVDTAHGHTAAMSQMIKKLKNQKEIQGIDIVAGNVATASGAESLVQAGADGVKVGIGPGSICTTRIIAGIGVPQITAILDIKNSKIVKDSKVPIIADGGMRYSGDISKAIVAGADCVMLGSMLAGCEESPGDLVFINGKQFKHYRGMGSLGVMLSKKSHSKDRYFHVDEDSANAPVPEGVEGQVPYRGTLNATIHQLTGGLKQTLFYVGAKTITELKAKGEFVQITNAGLQESHAHDIQMTMEAPNYSRKNK